MEQLEIDMNVNPRKSSLTRGLAVRKRYCAEKDNDDKEIELEIENKKIFAEIFNIQPSTTILNERRQISFQFFNKIIKDFQT